MVIMDSQPAQRWIEQARTWVFARWLLKICFNYAKGQIAIIFERVTRTSSKCVRTSRNWFKRIHMVIMDSQPAQRWIEQALTWVFELSGCSKSARIMKNKQLQSFTNG